MGFIETKKLATSDGKDEVVYTLTEECNNEEKLQGITDQISFYRKKSIVKLTSIKTDIRKTMLADFPFMAKI